MNGLHDLLAKIRKIEEAIDAPQAQYDIATQTLTYGGKQYKKASGLHNGVPLDPIVTAPAMSVGSRSFGPVNVVLKPDGTYYETEYSPVTSGRASANATPADGKARVDAPETTQQAIDRNKRADLAQNILKTQVKSKNDLGMVNGYYIEKETGVILHHMIANDRGGQSQGTVVRMDDLNYGQGKEFAEKLIYVLGKDALNFERITNPGPFGWKWLEHSFTVIKVNLQDLERVSRNEPPTMEAPPPVKPVEPAPVKPVEPAPVEPAPVNDQQTSTNGPNPKDIEELKAILAKLGATIPDQYDLRASTNAILPRPRNSLSTGLYKEEIAFKSLIGRTLLAEYSKITYLPADTVKPQPVTGLDVTKPETAQQVTTTPVALSPEERTKLIARANMLYDRLLPYKENPDVTRLLAAYLPDATTPVVDKPPVAPVVDKPPVAPVVDKPPVAPVVDKPPVKDKPENDQKKKYPEEWTTVKIVRATQKDGYGPQNQALYILGDGTKKRTFAYYRQENQTLVPMNINLPREDLKGYDPIPMAVAEKWGTGAQPTTDDKKRPGLDPNKGNPKIWDRQKQLQDAGALNTKGNRIGKPLTLDGIDGDNTRAAEKEFGPKIAAKPEDEQQVTTTDVPPMPWLTQAPPPKGVGLDPLFGTGNRDYIKWLERNAKVKPGDKYYWVNGDRYKLTGKPNQLQWQKDSVIVGMGSELNAQLRNYTGPEEHKQEFADAQQKIWTDAMYDRMRKEKPGVMKESGYTNDELNRIISLVHHR